MRKLLIMIMFLAASFPAVAAPMPTLTATNGYGKNVSDETLELLKLFSLVFEQTRRAYVDEVSDKKLLESAVNGMLTALDPHSGYMGSEDFKDMQTTTKGEFGGIGLEVIVENGVVRIISPIDDTPGFKAGIRPGDLITHIDDKVVAGLTSNEAIGRMRGTPKTKVKLTIRRAGAPEPLNITIVRDIIKIQAVKKEVKKDDVGYLRITSFNESTTKMAKAAVEEIKSKAGDKLIGYVIDLRNNPGGLLDQAIMVSDLFLERGEIVSTRPRYDHEIERFHATRGDITGGKPIVVLINEASASASEIVAGALQDHRRAVVVGSKSFGKGSVQTVYPVYGGGGIRLTTARYYTPSGRSIQAKGIEPDIEVKQATIEEQKSSYIAESEYANALDGGKAVKDKDTGKKDAKKADAAAKDKDGKEPPYDYQLERAIDILRGIAVYGSSSARPATAEEKAPAAAAAAPAKPAAKPKAKGK
ncbi:peptidase S41 [Alphaproteobacteria bacterium]|nr:peptidase S41 [Alphaproteobacteria bacterium]